MHVVRSTTDKKKGLLITWEPNPSRGQGFKVFAGDLFSKAKAALGARSSAKGFFYHPSSVSSYPRVVGI